MKPVRALKCQRREGKKSASLLTLTLIVIFACGSWNHSVAAKSLGPYKSAGSNADSSRKVDRVLKVENLPVHYVEEGAGPSVVMIHGNAGSVEDFELGALDLLASEYRVVAIDRPGHGRSGRVAAKATVEDQAELLHQTLASLGVTHPILVGHSWGASLALAYVLKYPGEVLGIVLLAPAAYPDGSGNRLLHAMIGTPVIGDLTLILGRAVMGSRMLRQSLVQAFYPQQPPAGYLRTVSSLWLRRRQLRAYFEDEFSLDASLRKMSRRYSEIKVPVVIVTGDQDRIIPPDRGARPLHAAIPQSRLIEIKDTGHEIPQTHPESIYTAVSLITLSCQK